jgi:uncharacterized protein YecA (UPF0149 family)
VPDDSELLNQTDHVIEHSSFERTITRDGSSVRIFIYRGREDAGWILEIEDELGGSTVWDDLFDSDRAALDEALQAIEQDGIHSFAEGSSDQAAMRALWDLTVAQPAIAALRLTLASANDMMSFHRACGVFAAVASAPELRMPSEWLDLVKGDHVFEGLAEVQRFTEGMMALYGEVVRSVTECGAHCCPPPEDHDAAREFCAGYVRIAISDSTWSRDARALAKLAPMSVLAGALTLEQLSELTHASVDDPVRWLQLAREELAVTVASLHGYWAEARTSAAARQQSVSQRRAAPKVGRNERCPCGSGRKFKKCCAP